MWDPDGHFYIAEGIKGHLHRHGTMAPYRLLDLGRPIQFGASYSPEYYPVPGDILREIINL